MTQMRANDGADDADGIGRLELVREWTMRMERAT